MKIINPNDSTHTIKLITRDSDISTPLDFELYDEGKRITESISSANFSVIDGYLIWEFDTVDFSNITFLENSTYQLKVSDGTDVVYRGKILATTQTTQDFKLTDGLYSYEGQ